MPQLHIRFIASNNYVSGNEYDLGKQFDISFVPQFFPEILISKNNFEYQGTVPNVANFYNFNYSESLKTEIALYVSNLQCPWNFRQQMLIHYDQKIQLLLFSMLRFITQSFDFQFKLDGYSKKLLNPFNNPISITFAKLLVFKIILMYKCNVSQMINKHILQKTLSGLLTNTTFCWLDYRKISFYQP